MLRLYLRRKSSTTMNLVLDYTQNGAVKYTLSIANVGCASWQYVGFSLNRLDGMVLFANPTGSVDNVTNSATYKTYTGMPPDVPRRILKVMQKLEFFGAVDVKFDTPCFTQVKRRRATFLMRSTVDTDRFVRNARTQRWLRAALFVHRPF